jgi:hypothetical protein
LAQRSLQGKIPEYLSLAGRLPSHRDTHRGATLLAATRDFRAAFHHDFKASVVQFFREHISLAMEARPTLPRCEQASSKNDSCGARN